MYKKVLSIILLLTVIFSLTACASKPSSQLLESNKDNSLVFLNYNSDNTGSQGRTDIEVPENYISMSDDVFAVLDENNEVIGYQKVVFDTTLNKSIFKPCDAEGTLVEETTAPSIPKLSSISLNKSNITIEVGKTQTLSIITDPENYDIEKAEWKSSDEKIASVSNGKIKGLSKGKATITVVVEGFEATCSVTVNEKEIETPVEPTPKPIIEVDHVEISKTSAQITVGKSVTLYASVYPSNATSQYIGWTSSDSKIATVYDGVVTGKKVGTATITATSNNGEKATCKITVKSNTVSATGITLNKKSASLNEGKTLNLTASISPSNTTNKKITWTSSNTNVAIVSGGTVTAKKEGTAIITAKTHNGKTATCTITVKPPAFSWKTISQSECPLVVSNEFDKYVLNTTSLKKTFSYDDYTYVMIKAKQGSKCSIKSISESNGKIIVKYANSGSTNYVFARFNRKNTNVEFILG